MGSYRRGLSPKGESGAKEKINNNNQRKGAKKKTHRMSQYSLICFIQGAVGASSGKPSRCSKRGISNDLFDID
jgi:hypothetical protein